MLVSTLKLVMYLAVFSMLILVLGQGGGDRRPHGYFVVNSDRKVRRVGVFVFAFDWFDLWWGTLQLNASLTEAKVNSLSRRNKRVS